MNCRFPLKSNHYRESKAMKKALHLFIYLFILILTVGCDEDNDSPPMIKTGPKNLFVANMTTLSVIDLENGAVANDVFGLGNAPNDIVIDGNLLIVVNSVSNDLNYFQFAQDGSLTPDGVVGIGVAQNNNPWAAAPDGQGHLLITNLLQNSISVFSTETREIERTMRAGMSPEGIIVEDGYAYMVNSGYDFETYTHNEGSVLKYDLGSWEVVDSLQVGVNPQDIQMDSFGWLHVVCTGDYSDISGKVYIVNPHSLSIHMVIETGGSPNHVAFVPDTSAYLSAGGWSGFGDPSGAVLKYRCDTGEILRDSENPIAVGMGANDIAISDNGRIFVSCFDDNRVDELRADTVYATFIVGTGPSAILLNE